MRSTPLLLTTVATVGVLAGILTAQDKPKPDRGRGIVPQPNALVPRSEIEKLTGDYEHTELSRDVHILWLSGPEDHRGGEHDYIRIQEVFTPLLDAVSRVTVEEAYSFPKQEQFDRADLLIKYLHLPDLTDEQLAMYQAFVDGGGAVFSIHESCIMRPVDRAEKLAGCIGCSWAGNDSSQWSKFTHDKPLFLKTEHPAFSGLPRSMRFNDESYWDLLGRENVEDIAIVAPENSKGSFEEIRRSEGARGNAFWTYTSGKGRVIGTTTGHYTYTWHDPFYRLLIARGTAWALDEEPSPFMSIVFEGITDENDMVGTTDNMLDYENRSR